LKTQLLSAGFLYRETAKKLTCAFTAALLLLCLTSNTVFAQKVKKLGKVKDFHSKVSFSDAAAPKAGIKTGKKIQTLQTSESTVNATINVSKHENGTETIIGEVAGSKGSAVYFNFRDGKVNGRTILPDQKKSYHYSTDENGEVVVTSENIDKVVCVEYETAPAASAGVSSAPPAGSYVYNLQSLPGAEAVVMLDFDGETVTNSFWNGGNTINAAPYDVTEAEVVEIFKMISEDFKVFNLNITTSEAVYQSAPAAKRVKCIFTPTNFYSQSAGGVAYVGSFTWGNNTPCWTFNGGVKAGGETGSHEIGHTLGLSHDGRTQPSEEYYSGIDAWAPIMGVGFYTDPVTWSKGEYPNANNTEDDLAIIAGTTNGFGYKTDDIGNTSATASALFVRPGGVVLATENAGIINSSSDVDVFSFSSTGGTLTLNVNGAAYQNLNVGLTLRNSSGTVIATADPANTMNATIAANVAAGTYYLTIDGVGHGALATGGYTDYSSIGTYTIDGTLQGGNTPPTVSVTAPAANSYFLAGSTVTITASASDVEGPVTKVEFYRGTTKLGEDLTSPYSFTWTNAVAGNHNLTAKAYDQGGLSTVSAEVLIFVDGTAPTVSLIAPANNSQFTAPASFELTSSPNDTQGPIKKVEFYQNGVKIGEDLYYPTFGWYVSNLAAGTYTFTAKAYDQVGLVGTSAPITVTVNATSCILTEAAPLASNYVVRNSWNDQASGSSVINESGALKVIQRAWGQNELYVIETGKSFNITNGQVYNVKFDFKDFQSIPVAGVDVGFATGLNTQNSGPVLVQSLVAAPAGYSSANFTTKSLNITSAYTGSVKLVFRLRWNSQPTAQISDYIKNITICTGAGTPSRSADADVTDLASVQTGVSFMPNPSAESFRAVTNKAVDLLTVTDMKGTQVYQLKDAVAGEQVQFGDDFTAGVYFVSVHYADGSREILRVIRTE
jgi:hypothetical protein